MKRACSWLLPSDYELYTSKGFQVFRLGFSNPAHEYGVRQARLLCYSIAMPEERKMLILTGARHDIGCAAVPCFSALRLRVIASSCPALPENCVRKARPEDRASVDLTDHADIKRGVETVRERRHGAPSNEPVDTADVSPKRVMGARPGLAIAALQDRYDIYRVNLHAPLKPATGGRVCG